MSEIEKKETSYSEENKTDSQKPSENKPRFVNKSFNKGNSDYKKRNTNYDNKNFGDGDNKRRIYLRKKICRFCHDKTLKIDYKNFDLLRRFTTEGGKIIPRRITGNCAKHQRLITSAIKRARYISLIPYLKK